MIEVKVSKIPKGKNALEGKPAWYLVEMLKTNIPKNVSRTDILKRLKEIYNGRDEPSYWHTT